MAFKAANDIFDAVFGSDVPEQEKTLSEAYLAEVADYLKTRTNVPGAVEMGTWIAEGKPVSSFLCRADMTEPLAENLREAGIPYAVLYTEKGQNGFLIRAEDGKRTDEVKAQTLAKASRICRIVSGEKMMQEAAASRHTDKSCLAIHGLTLAQAMYIKESYAQHFFVPEIGMDLMSDGTYTLTVMGKGSIKENTKDGQADICTIMLETVLKTSGPNGPRNCYYAEQEADYKKRLTRNFQEKGVNLNRTPLWVIGKGPQYMKITATGFTYGYAEAEGNEITFVETVMADESQPDYHQMLISYTRRIPYKVFTHNTEAVYFHFKNKTEDDELDFSDTTPEPIYFVYRRGEKELVALLDKIMTRKISGEQVMTTEGRWHEKFARYMNEAKAVIEALGVGRLPAGYLPEDLKAVEKVLQKYKLEAEMYERSIAVLQEIQAIPLENSISRISDIQQKMVDVKDAMEKAKEEERQRQAILRARAKAEAAAARSGGVAGPKLEEEETTR